MKTNVGYYDLEGRFLYATPSLATFVGMTPEELIGRTWYEIGVPPEAVGRLEAARREVLATGEPRKQRESFEIGGRLRESEFLIKPILGADGMIAGTVVTAWDVREPPRTVNGRDRLDRAYQILSAIDQVLLRTRDRNVIFAEACRIAASIGGFELAWVGILDPVTGDVPVIAQAGRDEGLLPQLTISVRSDPTGRGVVGTSIRENRSVIVQDVVHDHRMDAWRGFFDRLGYQTAAGFPIRVERAPIGTFAMYSSEAGHFDAAEAHLFEQVTDDISTALTRLEIERARAEAQAALAASELRYRDVFNLSPHPVAVYDTKTLRFLAVNEAAIAEYGYTRDEFVAMPLTAVLPAEDVPTLIAEVGAVLPGGGYRRSGLWRQVRKDGSLFYAEVSTHELEFDGRPARLVQAIDVTERRRLEAQLAEATRMEAMGHLAGGIAHDFNNLLTAVNGYADILVASLGDDPRAEAAIEIRRAGARAADLTKQVLAFARRQSFEPRPVDVNAVVASVGQMLRRLVGEQIRLVTSLDAAPAVVRADPGQLEQVLVNLTVNSRDAMPEAGVLRIEVGRLDEAATLGRGVSGPGVLLRVTDTGCGMDEATLVRAFEPFFTTKGLGRGTGLGLATCYGIVQQSGGDIWAESTVGVGTTVSVLFPAVEAHPEPIELPVSEPPALEAQASVLVVEDDAAVRAFVVTTLEHAGCRVLVAGTPSQARALSTVPEPIHLLLTDLVMPGGSGEELAEELVAARPQLRVVLMSGYDSTLADGGDNGRFRFLAKPFGAQSLAEAVCAALGEAPEATPPSRAPAEARS